MNFHKRRKSSKNLSRNQIKPSKQRTDFSHDIIPSFTGRKSLHFSDSLGVSYKKHSRKKSLPMNIFTKKKRPLSSNVFSQGIKNSEKVKKVDLHDLLKGCKSEEKKKVRKSVSKLKKNTDPRSSKGHKRKKSSRYKEISKKLNFTNGSDYYGKLKEFSGFLKK